MKTPITTFIFLLLFTAGYSQSNRFNLADNLNPKVKQQSLDKAVFIHDLSPYIWSKLSLPSNDRYGLNQRRINTFLQPQPENYLYPQQDYKLIIEVVYTQISVTVQGKTRVAKSTSDKLSAEQKDILKQADMGSDIDLKLRYKYKNQTPDNFGSRDKIAEGSVQLTMVPDTEAEFPGGFKQLSAYFENNVINKIADKNVSEKIFNATIRFTINADGQVQRPEVVRTSTSARIDQLLLEAMGKMPKWKPSVNANGTKVKQEFTIPFSSGC